MSFILESIKQAERERKLGQQQAPEISIEYTGAHIEDIENNKTRWTQFLIGLTITAILVWSVAYYLTNQDKQYAEKVSIDKIDNNSIKEDMSVAQVKTQTVPKTQADTAQHNFSTLPVKKLHTSNLKSVKLITEDEEVPIPVVARDLLPAKQSVESNSVKKSNAASESNDSSDTKSVVDKQPKIAAKKLANTSNKQELVNIYADLAALDKAEPTETKIKPPIERLEPQHIQIKTANYVPSVTNAAVNEKREIDTQSTSASSYNLQHEKAVSSGVPSFGELPYDIQESIPEFNVSVHMFHADPLQRRIRINGQMYTEGKSLQQDLALVEITRYGAVFDYQGNLFRFNVR